MPRLWPAVDRPRLVRTHPLVSCRGGVLHGLWNAAPRRVRGPTRELGSATPAGALAAVGPTNAARPRRNGEPQAWAQWPCDQVAAIPPMGAARRRARTALRYTGAPRRLRPTSPTPAKLLNLTHTTNQTKASEKGAQLAAPVAYAPQSNASPFATRPGRPRFDSTAYPNVPWRLACHLWYPIYLFSAVWRY